MSNCELFEYNLLGLVTVTTFKTTCRKTNNSPSLIYFSLEAVNHSGVPMKNKNFTPVQLWEKDPMRQKGTSSFRRGENAHSVSFEPVSPCWVEFDIQPMRQGSTQGGQPPCNINSHLESSCGYEHETLKKTAAMDPLPSHHLLHCLWNRLPYCFLKPKWGEKKNIHKLALIPHEISLLTAVVGRLYVSVWGFSGDVTNMCLRKVLPMLFCLKHSLVSVCVCVCVF